MASSCPPHFDGKYCWPATPSPSLAKIQCPDKEHENSTMTRWCSQITVQIEELNATVREWQNAVYGECMTSCEKSKDISIQQKHVGLFVMDQISYAFSIVCLILAMCIYWKFRQLRNTRVRLHLNLFGAILLHAVITMIQNFLYGASIYNTILINPYKWDHLQSKLICRTLMTVTHYLEFAIFIWLLIENWYFYCLISKVSYRDPGVTKVRMFIGWGTPLIVVSPWVVINLHSSKPHFCWIDQEIGLYTMMIPTLIINLIHQYFFIHNLKVIVKKINVNTCYESKQCCQFFKTLLIVLVLCGIYNFIYSTWSFIENKLIKLIFLTLARGICSLQGAAIAIIFCLANRDVKNEITKAWKIFKLQREVDLETSRRRNRNAESFDRYECGILCCKKNSELNKADCELYI